jgi:hypothetical protein
MGIDDTIKQWLFKVALGKAIKSLAKVIVAWCAAKGIVAVFMIMGLPFDTGNLQSVELALTAMANSALTFIKNWAKHRWPSLSKWL